MTAVLIAMSAVAPSLDRAHAAGPVTLPLGDADLVETRTVETLTAGVTLTRIQRGRTPAPPDQIPTTTRGPWRVNVLTIDRARARGHLRVTHGEDLSRTEPTTELVRMTGALAGVNGSFFRIGTAFPGDPVGLGVYGGRLLSEPALAAVAPNESDLLVDARTNRVSFGRHSWSGAVTNRVSRRRQPVELLNSPPVVPRGCRRLVDQTTCARDGDVSLLTTHFGGATPSGRGVEVVLDRGGCVVRTARTRGTVLVARQWSLQATGRDTRSLLRVRLGGCLHRSGRLLAADGQPVMLGPWSFGVNGRHRLASSGRIVVPTGPGAFFDRNPRTVVGTTGTGQVVVVTVDGRRPSSVGTTMAETAAVVGSLGLRHAVNLDGGGSTTMSVRGVLVNRPSGSAERPVADALVYVDEPFPHRG
ncbi:MAG TPA: phosphodiester glycosidase family protein [Nocardioidaceae bacterium]|nr:phosphodiester glycosidase family protein [Nocardioidaceae bacterium]